MTALTGIRNSPARNLQSASFAFPSVAGAWIRTFKSSPSQPTIPFRDAPGTTLTPILTGRPRVFGIVTRKSWPGNAGLDNAVADVSVAVCLPSVVKLRAEEKAFHEFLP